MEESGDHSMDETAKDAGAGPSREEILAKFAYKGINNG